MTLKYLVRLGQIPAVHCTSSKLSSLLCFCFDYQSKQNILSCQMVFRLYRNLTFKTLILLNLSIINYKMYITDSSTKITTITNNDSCSAATPSSDRSNNKLLFHWSLRSKNQSLPQMELAR